MLHCPRSPLSRAPCAGGRILRNTFCLAIVPKRLSPLRLARCLRTFPSLPRGVNSSSNPRFTTTSSRLPSHDFPRPGIVGAPSSAAMSVEERQRKPAATIEPLALLARSITPSCCLAVLPPPPTAERPVSSRPRTCQATQHSPAPMAALGSIRGTPNSPASGVRRGGPQA